MDAAERWKIILPGSVLPGSLVIDPLNPATLYAAMHHGVYKSTDGGASWSAALSCVAQS
jgi:hypothetical protein